MSLPRALEKLDDRAMQPLPPHKLTIGIFSKLWRSEKSASLIVEALYSGVKKILRRSCDVANRPFPGFFPLSLCAVAQAGRLEKSHNRLTCCSAARTAQVGAGRAVSQLRQVVRYSIRLRCNTTARHHRIGPAPQSARRFNAPMAGNPHQAVANGLTGRLPGFDRIAGLS